MDSSDKKTTIEDVAKQAGVSIGTVDRVLNRRNGVSEKTRRKVERVINATGYTTNKYASALSKKKSYLIAALIPFFQKGEYWELLYNGILKATEQIKDLNVSVRLFQYNQFELSSFKAACRNVLDAKPNALLIAPIYKDEVTKLIKRLSALSIPATYIDAKPENTDYLAYYGMPLFESGYLAADLLVGSNTDIKTVVSFNIDRGEAPPNDSMLKRNKGFLAYLKDYNPNCRLIDCTMSPYDYLANIALFDKFFAEHTDINHIVTFNSRAHLISDWIDIRNIKDKKLLGFDMLESNIRALKKGTITTLIAERSDQETCKALMALVDYLVFNILPKSKDNYASIDILNRYNVDFYIKE